MTADRPSAVHAWAAVATWMAVVVILSTFPVGDLGPSVSNADKIGHAAAYAVLGFLCAVAWHRHGCRVAAVAERSLALALLFGALMELVQAHVGREPGMADWVADGVGALVGIGSWKAWRMVVETRAERVG